jgi:hypothetical protein
MIEVRSGCGNLYVFLGDDIYRSICHVCMSRLSLTRPEETARNEAYCPLKPVVPRCVFVRYNLSPSRQGKYGMPP